MILSNNRTDEACSTFSKYEEYDSQYITRSASIMFGVDLEQTATTDVNKSLCDTDKRDEDDEYQLKTDTVATEYFAYSQPSSLPLHSLEHEELEEDVAYTRSLSSSLRSLEHEDVERVGHYVSDSSCIESGIDEDSCWNAFRTSPLPNFPQRIDCSLKRANPVYDEDSDSELEQEEYRHISKRNKTLGFLST